MSKIVLVEYMGLCSKDGEPLGHSYKVQKEYCEMLGDDFEVSIATPKNTAERVYDKSKVEYFSDYNSVVMESASFTWKVKDFLGKINNVRKTVKNVKADYYWFYNIDYSLLFYLAFNPRILRKSVITFYRNSFGGKGVIRKMKAWIVDRVMRGSLLNIYTGSSFKMPEENSYYMPDYYYIPEKFDRCKGAAQEDLVVCLGTMNRFKLLDPAVDAFSKINYPLFIGGKFYDEEWKNSLLARKGSNVEIRDGYLDSEEYLETFKRAKFCIIPYDRSMYNLRTSGVLQECVFTRTVPLTFNWFLEQNESLGLGVDDLSEITDEMLQNYDATEYLNWCEEQIATRYNKELITGNLIAQIKRRAQ